jgi:transposase
MVPEAGPVGLPLLDLRGSLLLSGVIGTCCPRISAVTDQPHQIKRDSGQWALSRARHKAHARRKFDELYVNHKSQIAGEALEYFGALYKVERKAQDRGLDADARRALRQAEAVPVSEHLHEWLTKRLAEVAPGSATAKAIKYSLGRWVALTRYLGDGDLPIDNNWLENRIRPVALGRASWLFAGSDRAGRRAAVVMALIQTARLHGLDPYAYLRDVLERLPLIPASQIGDLLPGVWKLSRPTKH